jgi:hypothetical protein
MGGKESPSRPVGLIDVPLKENSSAERINRIPVLSIV